MIGVCMEQDPEELRRLADLALKKLSEYAKELNSIDNGARKEYQSIEQFQVDNAIN